MDEWLQMDKKYKGWNDTQFWKAQKTCENKKKIAYVYLPRHILDLYESYKVLKNLEQNKYFLSKLTVTLDKMWFFSE